jgi:hypothetical protein
MATVSMDAARGRWLGNTMATVTMDAVVGPWTGFLARSLVQYEMSFHVLDNVAPSILEAERVGLRRSKAGRGYDCARARDGGQS